MNSKTSNELPKITHNKIEALLKEDGSKIYDQLILTGLFLMIFESLKQEVITYVDDFLAVPYTDKKGLIRYRSGDEFIGLIKKHKNKKLAATLYWIHDLGGITTQDQKELRRFLDLRNDIGHELLHVLTMDKKPLITISDVKLLLDMHMKITKWCIEVDLGINPYLAKKADYDLEKTESLKTLLLKQIIFKVAECYPDKSNDNSSK